MTWMGIYHIRRLRVSDDVNLLYSLSITHCMSTQICFLQDTGSSACAACCFLSYKGDLYQSSIQRIAALLTVIVGKDDIIL